MKTKYFNNIRTAEELKKAYKDIAKKLHPDMPTGDTKKFQEMQNEYEKLWDKYKSIHSSKDGKIYSKDTDEIAKEYMDIINAIIKFKDCTIEIIGSWIWISGDTKKYKDMLKNLKFGFSGNKSAWYYHTGPYKRNTKSKLKMDDLRSMWGSVVVDTNTDEQVLIGA